MVSALNNERSEGWLVHGKGYPALATRAQWGYTCAQGVADSGTNPSRIPRHARIMAL